jgi:UDP-3-O-[3-hydroxymyristoyl] glucosamine N-acyltransferase
VLTTGEIAVLVGATCEGPGDRPIRAVAPLDRAGSDEVSLCTGGRYLKELPGTRSGAVILGVGAVPDGVVALRCANPRAAFAKIAATLHPQPWPEAGIDARAAVHPSAKVDGVRIDAFAVVEEGAVIGEGSWLQAHAYVGRGSIVGRGCRIMPGAVVMDECTLGDRVFLKPGAVVGADGFGYVVDGERIVKVPQLGTVAVEDDVEIGANACVDRAALTETRIGRGSRLDNMVQIAHGVSIGARCLLAAFSGVAGSAKLGDGVVMGGRAAVIDGVSVGSGSFLAALASASRDFPAGSRLGGSPARPYRQWLRELAALRRIGKRTRDLDLE